MVLSAGLSEQVVRRRFDAISSAFLEWTSAKLISERSHECESRALEHFGNFRKVRAIVETAEFVAGVGFPQFRSELFADPIETLEKLPFMGPATSRHLAKNIGLDVVKPDRHLMRLAAAARYSSADELCQKISSVVGDRVSVIDTVLWRYSTFSRMHLSDFANGFDRFGDS